MSTNPFRPSRLRSFQARSRLKVIDRIKPERLDAVESDLNRDLPISATAAEISLWVLAREESGNHRDDFLSAPYNCGHDYSGLTSLELHKIANGDKSPLTPKPRGSK